VTWDPELKRLKNGDPSIEVHTGLNCSAEFQKTGWRPLMRCKKQITRRSLLKCWSLMATRGRHKREQLPDTRAFCGMTNGGVRRGEVASIKR